MLRRLLLPVVACAALAGVSAPALAAYPDKPIRLIVPSAPGGAPDALMRAHGSVACGPTLQTAVFRAVYTEVSARVQQAALMHGLPIAALSEAEGLLADETNLGAGMRAWDLWRSRVTF